MTFDLRPVIDDNDLEPFQFIAPSGDTHALPHLQTLTPRQALSAMDGNLESVLREVAPDVADVVMDLPSYATNELLRAWMTHSNVDLEAAQGKSDAPSPQSSGTAKRSRRTRNSAASTSRS